MTSVPVVARRNPVMIDSDISFIKLLPLYYIYNKKKKGLLLPAFIWRCIRTRAYEKLLEKKKN